MRILFCSMMIMSCMAALLHADIIIGDKIMLGGGQAPCVDIEKKTGDIHVFWAKDGGVAHAEITIDGTIKRNDGKVADTDKYAGGHSGPPAGAVNTSGEPTIVFNGAIGGNNVPAWIVPEVSGSWKPKVQYALADGGNGKGNRPWEHAAGGDYEGNIWIFTTLALHDQWEESPRIVTVTNGTSIVRQETVFERLRSEGYNDMVIDRWGNAHFASANSSSGFRYRKWTPQGFGKVVSEGGGAGSGGFTAGVTVDTEDNIYCLHSTKRSSLHCFEIKNDAVANKITLDNKGLAGAITCDSLNNLYVVYFNKYWGDNSGDKKTYLKYRLAGESNWKGRLDLDADEPKARQWFHMRGWKHQAVMAGTKSGQVFVRIITPKTAPVKIRPIAGPKSFKQGVSRHGFDVYSISGRRMNRSDAHTGSRTQVILKRLENGKVYKGLEENF